MKKWTFLVALALCGCTSSGVIPTGDDVYMISKNSAGCGFATADGALADVYKEANEYCDKQGKKLKTVDVEKKDGVPFVHCAEATLHFSCT
jgi:uncharacterized protein YcfL